jgi:alpha-beta hydrolase superfamily lysophospholipase
MADVAGDPNWKTKITTLMMEYQYDPKWLTASEENKRLFEKRVDRAVNSRRPQKIIALQAASIAQVDTRSSLPQIPSSLPVLVIHGKLDRMVSYQESEAIVKNIKHAKRFDPGSKSDNYGHYWFDYYGSQWWADEVEKYLASSRGASKL